MLEQLTTQKREILFSKLDFRVYNSIVDFSFFKKLDVVVVLDINGRAPIINESDFHTKDLYKVAVSLNWYQKQLEQANEKLARLAQFVDLELIAKDTEYHYPLRSWDMKFKLPRCFYSLSLPVYTIIALALEPELISKISLQKQETDQTIKQMFFSGE